jgi:biotin operon repressor
MDQNNEMLDFFKALADASRLKILGILAQHPCSGEELAALLGLKPSTVSHHLSRLAREGLVSARAEGYYSIYHFEERALEKMQLLFSRTALVSSTVGVDVDAYDRKVIRDFTRPDGSLKEIPARRRKLEAILRHIVREFEPGRRYPEKQVNAILSRFHPDTASLRRELIASKLMHRAGGEYWLLAGVNQSGLI